MQTRTNNQNLQNDRFYQDATQNQDIEGLQLALARHGFSHTERDANNQLIFERFGCGEQFCESES